jgi:hypothetical protein
MNTIKDYTYSDFLHFKSSLEIWYLRRLNWIKIQNIAATSSDISFDKILSVYLPDLLEVDCSFLDNFAECKTSRFLPILFVISLWSFRNSATNIKHCKWQA